MPPENFENLDPLRLNLRAFLMIFDSQLAMLKYKFLGWWGSSGSSGKITYHIYDNRQNLEQNTTTCRFNVQKKEYDVHLNIIKYKSIFTPVAI